MGNVGVFGFFSSFLFLWGICNILLDVFMHLPLWVESVECVSASVRQYVSVSYVLGERKKSKSSCAP